VAPIAYNRASLAGGALPLGRRRPCIERARPAAPTGGIVNALLALSRAIDAVTERVGRTVYWLVLVVVLISAANATIRKLFNYSSNAYLEIQWYLFSVIFLFGAGYVLLHNAHVRIDIVAGPIDDPAREDVRQQQTGAARRAVRREP
jgi:hypothetical protein